MNDAQVKQQIQQMVSFIRQEAEDKANEIRVKAEEDFNIRKLSAVEAAREKIRSEYERKSKQIDVNRKIAQSTEMNAARLQVLKARDGVLREVYEEAGKQLTKLANDDPERYSELVKDAIFQGLVKLGDNEVLVRCRKKDLKTVEGMLPDISDSYTSKTGKSLKVEVDKKTFLSENSAGGVTLLSEYGRIVVENTFESRLEIAYQQNLPQIRQILFQEQDKESSN